MPARQATTSIWVVLGVAVTVLFGVFSFVWSIIQGQVTDLKTEFVKYQNDARWSYATKDYVNGKLEGLKEEELTYRKGLERELLRKQ